MKNLLLTLLFLFGLTFTSEAYPENYTQYASPVVFTCTGTSSQALAANAARTYLLMVNKGAVTVQVRVGAVQSGTEGIPIPPGGSYEPILAPSQKIYCVTATSTAAVTIVQGNGK